MTLPSGPYRDVIVAGTSLSCEHELAQIAIIGHHIRMPG
jgi:hypothetical protein